MIPWTETQHTHTWTYFDYHDESDPARIIDIHVLELYESKNTSWSWEADIFLPPQHPLGRKYFVNMNGEPRSLLHRHGVEVTSELARQAAETWLEEQLAKLEEVRLQ